MTDEGNFSISSVLKNIDIFAKNETLATYAESIFEFTQYLLDEDDNITKTGNLKSSAETQLEERIEEILLPKMVELEEEDEFAKEN